MPVRRNDGRPLRVLHVVASGRRRGAETFAVDLAAELERRGIGGPVVALAASPRGADSPDGLVPGLGRRRLGPTTLVAIRRLASSTGADLLVAHGSRTLPACALALVASGVPFVYRSIGDPRVWSSSGARRWRTTRLLRRAARVVALWPEAADALESIHRVPSSRVRVIPNGVPADRCPVPDAETRRAARARWGLRPDGDVVAYLGSLTREKDVGAAITAVSRLPDVEMVIAGEGPERAELEARAAAITPGRVRFVGVVAGAAPVLAAADAVVLASRTEGVPGVLIEAGLSGLPAVATAVGGVAEVVDDGVTGVLAAPGDVAGLTAGLERALANRDAMGEAARRRCLERFEIGIVARAWADLLTDLTQT
jgi:glycosyltransferase involved in cell wall biosynthesis